MSKLAVLHLSDIHIQSEKDLALGWSDVIASSCYAKLRDADACLIAITGDIAYKGSAKEFEMAKERLLKPLIEAIRSETGKPVYVAIAPGNHDCVLVPPDAVREIVIDGVISDPKKAEDESIVRHCTSAQENFFSFLSDLATPEPTQVSRLLWQQVLEVGGNKVVVTSLNASWMSRLSEQQGQMVYPIKKFENSISRKEEVHLALIHHPFNWYAQESYQALRKRLRLSCTAVLSGHEHTNNAGKVEDTRTGSSLFFEAGSLQPHEKNVQPGYSFHFFDISEKTVCSTEFVIESGSASSLVESTLLRWDSDSMIHDALNLQPDFISKLTDPGGNFTHASKEHLTLDDVYIWPDLRDWDQQELGRQKQTSSYSLPQKLIDGGKVIVYGEDKSGRSSLLFKVYLDLINRGFAPVYLSGPDVPTRNDVEVEKQILKAIESQYVNVGAASSIQKSKRVLLVDDVDRMKSGASNIHHLLKYAERHFAGVCVTAASSFEVTNLVSKDASAALVSFSSYDLLKFGLKLRHQLIKKWCGLAGIETKMDLDKKVDEVETIVNAVIGRQLVPEYPLYLLILLQSAEQHRQGELQNSGLSHYYQYLITKSLGSVGVKPLELDELFNYLAHLAWKFQQSGTKELEFYELDECTREYSSRFFTVQASQRLPILEKARIVSKRGEFYSFTYPYIYYYFVGYYLSRNIDAPEVKSWVEDSCKKLYLHDRAHSVMFLTHHAKNTWVIELICDVLKNCFSDKSPIELNGDTSFLNALVERSAQLTIDMPDVEKNQEEVRELNDKISEVSEDSERESFDELSLISKFNLLHKTAAILGLILKNYYGSLEREQKKTMIVEVFNAPLRATRLWLEEVSTELDGLVQSIRASSVDDGTVHSDEEEEKRVKRKLFNLLNMVATGAVISAGSYVSSNMLRDDISGVVNDNPTNSYRLIEVASRLLRPGSVPLPQIKLLANELEKNPYAFSVLQSLGYMHMYMYHTDEQTKQSLCKTLKISILAKNRLAHEKSKRLLR